MGNLRDYLGNDLERTIERNPRICCPIRRIANEMSNFYNNHSKQFLLTYVASIMLFTCFAAETGAYLKRKIDYSIQDSRMERLIGNFESERKTQFRENLKRKRAKVEPDFKGHSVFRDDELGWVLRPNVHRGDVGMYGIITTTDKDGHRITPGAENFSESPRIFFTGDSFAFGGEVEDDETVEFFLQEKLKQRVLNGGRCSG